MSINFMAYIEIINNNGDKFNNKTYLHMNNQEKRNHIFSILKVLFRPTLVRV